MDDVQPEVTPINETATQEATPQETPAPAHALADQLAALRLSAVVAPTETGAASDPPSAEATAVSAPRPERQERQPRPEGGRPPRQGQKPQGPRGDRPPRPEGQTVARGPEGQRREGKPAERGDRGPRPDRGDRRDVRPGGGRPFDFNPEIELEKLISDSLYLDNQAHAVVARMHDMDSGTKSQLRRLYNAVRRAVRSPEGERQHQFVMLRARLAYTIARHSLRSLDALERLLLQVTRRNDARGYERFKDLFEAIVAYNE